MFVMHSDIYLEKNFDGKFREACENDQICLLSATDILLELHGCGWFWVKTSKYELDTKVWKYNQALWQRVTSILAQIPCLETETWLLVNIIYDFTESRP